jgi:hypothetical protein
MAGRLHFADGFDYADELEFMNYYRKFSGSSNSGTGVYHVNSGAYLTDGGILQPVYPYHFTAAPGAVPATGPDFIWGECVSWKRPSKAFMVMEFRYADVEEISVECDVDGYLLVKRGSTLLATSTNPYNVDDGWHYIVFKCTLHSSAGSFELYVDHSLECSGSGVNTSLNGALSINGYRMGYPWQNRCHQIWFADTGAVPTADWVVQSLYVVGDGNHSDFTPSAGANWENVDEADFDLDGTFNESGVVTDRDSYIHANPSLAITGDIEGVTLHHYVRNIGPGSRAVDPFLRQTGANYDLAPYNPAILSYYQTEIIVIPNSPETATNFTPTEIDDLESGLLISA